MTIHHATFLLFYDSTGTAQFGVQNYYQQATITIDSVDYQLLPFDVGELASTQSADTSAVTITLPALTSVVAAVEAGLAAGWLANLRIFRFEAATAPDTPPASQTVLLDFIGEINGGNSNFESSITVEIGSALAPLGSQVPPRLFTSALVGVPCRL